MKCILTCLPLFIAVSSFSQAKDEAEIRSVLTKQTESWNNGDIESFMTTYWHSDSLMFIGKNGVKWGWQTTLENYKKSSFSLIKNKNFSYFKNYTINKFFY